MGRFLLVGALLEGLLRLSWRFSAASRAVWRPAWASWSSHSATRGPSDRLGGVSESSWRVFGALWEAWKAALLG
eukprot:866698-Pyramimonas_sp.AAC.1